MISIATPEVPQTITGFVKTHTERKFTWYIFHILVKHGLKTLQTTDKFQLREKFPSDTNSLLY